MRSSSHPYALSVALLVVLAGCGEGGDLAERADDAGGAGPASTVDSASQRLGPRDGRELPPHDLDRVQVGDTAPDFTLASYGGGTVSLSEFRAAKEVVLVFYRGHW